MQASNPTIYGRLKPSDSVFNVDFLSTIKLLVTVSRLGQTATGQVLLAGSVGRVVLQVGGDLVTVEQGTNLLERAWVSVFAFGLDNGEVEVDESRINTARER